MPSRPSWTFEICVATIHENLKNEACLKSVRSQNNIRKALCRLHTNVKSNCFAFGYWKQCYTISPQVFILFSATFSPDSLSRMGKYLCERVVDVLKERVDYLNNHIILTELATIHCFSDKLDSFALPCNLSTKVSEISRMSEIINQHDDLLSPTADSPCSTSSISYPSPRYTQSSLHKTEAENIFESLKMEEAFRYHLPPDFDARKLSTLSCLDDYTRSLWEQSTTGVPLLVPAKACWRGAPPTFEQIWTEAAKIPAKAYSRGEPSRQPSLAFCQLAKPSSTDPIYIIGIQPRALVGPDKFGSCPELHQKITTFNEQEIVYNVTPKNTVVDLHIDYGEDGLSATINDCEKTWFLFPPIEHNLSWMEREGGQQAKLARGLDVLEGGIIHRTTSEHALYIPSGTLHSTFTQSGGFLISLDCTTRTSVQPFSEYLRHGLHLNLDADGQQNCLFLFLECWEVALHNSNALTAMRSWVNIEAFLRTIVDAGWKAAAAIAWQRYKAKRVEEFKCPCGRMEGDDLFKHFQDEHTWFNEEVKSQRRRRWRK